MNRSIFGWSLPPGCGRLPGEEPDPFELQMKHRCPKCGAFLKLKPDKSEGWEDARDCSGKLRSYPVQYDEGSIQILGEEYRGKTYDMYDSDCGLEKPHKPHRVVDAAGVTETYLCRKCGESRKVVDA